MDNIKIGDIICYKNPKSGELFYHKILECHEDKYVTSSLNYNGNKRHFYKTNNHYKVTNKYMNLVLK